MLVRLVAFGSGSGLLLADDTAADELLSAARRLAGRASDHRPFGDAVPVLSMGCVEASSDDEGSRSLDGTASELLEHAAAKSATMSGGCGARGVLHVQTGGAPYMLVLTTIGSTPVCAYVTRRKAPGHSRHRVVLSGHVVTDPLLFDGTILTGDLVRGHSARGREEWCFLSDDCLAARGACIETRTLTERLAARDRVTSCILDSGFGAVRVRRKAMHPCDAKGSLEVVWRLGRTLPYSCRGVLMKSTGRAARDLLICSVPAPGTERRMEWNPPPSRPRRQDIDALEAVRMVETGMPDVYAVLDECGLRREDVRVSVPTLALSQQLRRAFADLTPGAVVRWRCRVGAGGRLIPVEGGAA